jgi:hypothetical protein
MSEQHRKAVKKVVVLPGRSPASGSVTGSYEKQTDGVLDGIGKGSEIGVSDYSGRYFWWFVGRH